MSTRWKLLYTTTPSGRRLFRCGKCGRESVAPDKECPAGCVEPERTRSWVIDSGPEHELRASGCTCQWEIGDSPCSVHPTCECCGELNGAHAADCSFNRSNQEALAVLRAIGEAVATVARARMICTLMNQQHLRWEDDDDRVGLHLCFWRGDTLETSAVTLERYTSERPGLGERLAEWTGHPVDTAAEAVARFIEEAGR